MPNVGTMCTVCNHAEVLRINDLLLKGRTQRRVATEFGLNHHAVNRHVTNDHILGKGIPPEDAASAFTPLEGNPKEKLEALIANLELQVKNSGGNIRVDLARELRLAYADLDKLQAPSREGEDLKRREAKWYALLADLVPIFDAHPDLRTKVAELVEKHLGGDA